MNTPKLNYINEISPEHDSWTLKVRILRSHKQSYQMDLILMDEKMQKIHAIIRTPRLMKQFEGLVQENEIIMLSRFLVADNNGNYPVITHPFKINFLSRTIVKKCDDFDGPLHGIQMVSFGDILDGSIAENSIVDVIGRVVDCSEVDTLDHMGQDLKRLMLKLEDLQGTRIGCTLWASYVDQYQKCTTQQEDNAIVIILLQFAKIKLWKGIPSVQNSLFGTKLFVNADMDEINEMQSRLLNNPDQSHLQFTTTPSLQTLYSDRDSFLQDTPRKFVDELHEINEEMVCIIFGTIKSIKVEDGWYYLGCSTCNKKVVALRDVDPTDLPPHLLSDDKKIGYYCAKCKNKPKSVEPKYKVNIRVQDDTGTVSLTLFDKEVKSLIKKKAADIRDKQLQNDDDTAMPDEFRNLIDKKGAFRISISKFNIEKRWSVYTVLKSSFHEEVVAFLEKNKGNC